MLAPPQLGGFWRVVTLDPLTTTLLLVLGARAATLVVRSPVRFRAARGALVVAAVLIGLFAVDGWTGRYASRLLSVLTVRALLLLLVVPPLLTLATPTALWGGQRPGPGWLRALGRGLGHPLLGPALVPLLLGALFFSPLLGAVAGRPPVAWAVDASLLVVGSLLAEPLVHADAHRTSLGFGLLLAVGLVELLADAIPGVALRLDGHLLPATTALAALRSWTPTALHDQQLAGAILWGTAEILDLPFLLLVFWQWTRADQREAALTDQALDAQLAERPATASTSQSQAAELTRPWWEVDASVFGEERSRQWRR